MSFPLFFARTIRAFGFFALGACAFAVLSACGGGGGGGGVPAPAVIGLGVSVVADNTDCADGTECHASAAQERSKAEFVNIGDGHNPLESINAEFAYARGFTGKNVTIAIADHGIDMNHLEFAGRITLGYNAVNGAGLGDIPEDDTGHGTAVAGILAGGRDGKFMHGIAYDSAIIPIRVLVRNGGDYCKTSIPHDCDPNPKDWQFAAGIQHGIDNAFVVNNSWGYSALITFRVPGIGLVQAPRAESAASIENLKHKNTPFDFKLVRDALRDASKKDRMVIFASGNNGWNSENGIIQDSLLGPPTVIDPQPGSRYYVGQQITNLRSTIDVSGYLGLIPAEFPELQGHWLHVVALDTDNHIADFSNGCGAAQAWCIAAPGTKIRTPNTTLYGDSDHKIWEGGTSFAAPMVSGAAAVLKSAFPNLSAQQVVTLLLMSANKENHFSNSDVYGQGMLDLEEATRPQTHATCGEDGYDCPHRRALSSGLRLATAQSGGGDGLEIHDFAFADLADSRIHPSPVFGNAFSRSNAAAGFVDAFDRAYQTRISGLAGAPVALRGDPAQAMREDAGMRTRTLADGFFARETRNGLPAEFGWRARRGDFSAALTEARNWRAGNVAGAWNAAFALGADRWRGVEFAAGALRAGFRAAEFSATGALLRQWFLGRDFAGGGWSVSPEAGFFDEDGSILGAGFAGGFAAEGARTFYGKVDGTANLGFGLRGFAGALLARTSAENGSHSARFSDLHSGGWQAGLGGERWQFSFWRPAGVLSGEMRISGVAGYDQSGKYRAAESRVDLSAGHARRITFAASDAEGDVWWSAEKELGGAARFSVSGGRTF